MPRHHYEVFKHTVRKKLPKRIRYATVCRKCKKAVSQREKCMTCQTEFALYWGQAW